MANEFEKWYWCIIVAKVPEDVFDEKTPPGEVKKLYKKIAKIIHPDIHSKEKAKAQEAFQKLQVLIADAEKKISDGTYGNRSISANPLEPIAVKYKKHTFLVHPEIMSEGDICNLYQCTIVGTNEKAVFKIVKDHSDNDLVENEAKAIKSLKIQERQKSFEMFVPRLIVSFANKDPESGIIQKVNVLPYLEGFYSLKQIMTYYPYGVNPKDIAWMYRRILGALWIAHTNDIVHGAVIPTHIMIFPEGHGLMLIDWSYAVIEPNKTGKHIIAMSEEYESFYPPEVLARQTATFAIDLFMASTCMLALLGDPVYRDYPYLKYSREAQRMQEFFKLRMDRRDQDVVEVLDGFDKLIESFWGERKFHNFYVPPKK